jgi:hypothetical protein
LQARAGGSPDPSISSQIWSSNSRGPRRAAARVNTRDHRLQIPFACYVTVYKLAEWSRVYCHGFMLEWCYCDSAIQRGQRCELVIRGPSLPDRLTLTLIRRTKATLLPSGAGNVACLCRQTGEVPT